jgi:hypothetical protein
MPRLLTLRVIGVVSATSGMLACMGREPKDSGHLAVLAVKAEPPTGAPGATVNFELLHSGELGPGNASTTEVAWLGGCNNPPGAQYFGCYPALRSQVAELGSRVADTPSNALEHARVGLGTTFSTTIPPDIIRGPYGVSFVFFAVCKGSLVPAPSVDDTVPLGCVDASGKGIGREGFAVGFTTVYSVLGLSNENPVIDGMDLDNIPLVEPLCAVDSDCPNVGAASTLCREPTPGVGLRCLRVLEPCAAHGCHRLIARINPASAEVNPLGAPQGSSPARESLELELVGRGIDGKKQVRGDGASIIGDASFGLDGLPPGYPDVFSLWLIARDGRGGVAWTERSFVARPPG